MKGTLLVKPKVFHPNLGSHCSGVTETSHLAPTVHSLQAVQVWSKSVINEGNFTLEAETVFPLCLASHCSGLTDTAYHPLLARGLQAVQVWSKSVSNEGYS
jgi:hypothetical protein